MNWNEWVPSLLLIISAMLYFERRLARVEAKISMLMAFVLKEKEGN